MMKNFAIVLAVIAAVVSFCVSANARSAGTNANAAPASLVAQGGPLYVPWYATASPWPTAIPSANVGLGGAIGAANLYNDEPLGSNALGLGILGTNACYFICFGAPGKSSHHMLAYGNSVQTPGPDNPGSYTTQGAPNDCIVQCPGGIPNSIFSITLHTSPMINGGYMIAADGSGNFGVYHNIVAGAAIVAGAGEQKPQVTSGVTSLTGGVRPNGISGGYAPEAFPLGASAQHPQILSGACSSATTPAACQFPNSFAFSDTTYNCTVTALGTSPMAASYARTSTTSIAIYSHAGGSFSYICMR